MIDILCMILSVIKRFIYIMTFHFKSIKRTINLTERKPERWTSRQLYLLIKKRKNIKLVHNHIMISFSVSIQEMDSFIVYWSVERCLQKLTGKYFSIDVVWFLFSTVVNNAYVIHLTQHKLQIIAFVCLKKLFADSRVFIIQKSQSLTEVCWIKRL